MTQHVLHTGVIGRGDLVTALANGDKQVLETVVRQLQLVRRIPVGIAENGGSQTLPPPEPAPQPSAPDEPIAMVLCNLSR